LAQDRIAPTAASSHQSAPAGPDRGRRGGRRPTRWVRPFVFAALSGVGTEQDSSAAVAGCGRIFRSTRSARAP